MAFWPIRGIIRRLTESPPARDLDSTGLPFRLLGARFTRSMHLFVVDAGCDNAANFSIAALEAPQFNTHRYGIYFADTPRHADLLIVLGPVLPRLVAPVKATMLQVPEPFGVLVTEGDWWKGVIAKERIVGRIAEDSGPREIFAALLAIQKGGEVA